MSILSTIAVFVVTFGVLITFHEYGHFWAARRSGIKVLRFSIGFGKPLLRWRDRHDTEFVVAALPLGGYVKMLDLRDADVDEYSQQELRAEEFTGKSVWSRIFVVAAGPVANLLLAILVLWGVYLMGERGLAPIVADVESGSIAAQAGLETGQEIVEVDGLATPTRRALLMQLLKRLGETGTLEIATRYPDDTLVYKSEVNLNNWLKGVEEPDPIAGLGLTLYAPPITLVLGQVVPASPAENAGLIIGDELLRADGASIASWSSWVDYVKARPGAVIELEYRRDDETFNTRLVPESINADGQSYGRVGLAPSYAPWPEDMIREYHYSPLEALRTGVQRTWELSVFSLKAIKKMLFGQMSAKNMAGPITIAQIANDSAKAGFLSWLNLLALLSISLGIMNLLPIPMLDGGHLMYFFVELMKGSPVSEKVQMAGQQFGFFVLVGVFLLVIFNDIARL